MSWTHRRTELTDPALPNLTDGRDGRRLYHYSLNDDGSIHVEAHFAGLGDGIGASGKRFPTLEVAASAVRAARQKVAARWSRKGYPHSLDN